MENDGQQLNNNSEQFLDVMGGNMENDGLRLNINNEQVHNFMGGTMENNGQQLMNNNNEQVPDIMGDDTALNYSVEYDMDALLGIVDQHHVGSNQRGDDGDRHSATGPPPSKRKKRFSVRQVQELEVMFKACTHPGPEVRQELGERIGLDEKQVKFWFQNRRSQQKRQCEYMAVVLHSSNVQPSSSSNNSSAGPTISAVGKRSVLELAQRMTASFYTVVSGPITVPSTNIVDQLCVSSGTGSRRLEVSVRMVVWNCADIMPGEPAITVMSATATVWLPGTPPQLVFGYLCNLQSRGEWDFFFNGCTVQELEYIPTSSCLHGNGVSVLRPTAATADGSHGTNSNMLILQQTNTDMSGSLVVYSLIEENLMHDIMGGANNAIFLVPSGFAILPDGHGKAHYTTTSSSSSAPISYNNGAGSLLTVAFQEMLSCGNNITAGTFDNAGQKLCHVVKTIKNAVGANNVIPA